MTEQEPTAQFIKENSPDLSEDEIFKQAYDESQEQERSDELSDEDIFKQAYESQQNGNITEFKIWLSELGEDTYYFIKWLQAERLSL